MARKFRPDKEKWERRERKKSRDLERRSKRHKRWRPSPESRVEDEDARFERMRRDYLRAHPECARCGFVGRLTLHHRAGQEGENRYLHFMALCVPCHNWAHEWRNRHEARAGGYLI